MRLSAQTGVSMEYSIEISDLSKHYQTFSLDHISFNLRQGSVMGFIGENGAGKSTTIKALLNLIRRDSGAVKILGLDSLKDERKIKEQIGVVFDECHFHESLTASDINSFMKKIYSTWDSRLYFNYLNQFNLPGTKKVKEYSRGMKMKLSIIAALAHSPRLLILDEPTSGLDPVVRNEILDIFFEFIQDEEHSILMSSHITNDLERIADYITFIHDGRIVFSDSKDSILEQYAIIKCSNSAFEQIDPHDIIRTKHNSFSYEVLTGKKQDAVKKYKDLTIDNASLEDIMMFYGKGEKKL